MPPRAWLANYRHYLERLLLSMEELSDPHWEPGTSIDVFLQARVRPAVYFLQRCAVGEGGLQGPPADIPPSEKEELRLLALRLAGTVRFLSRVRVYRGLVDNAPSLPLLLQDTPGLSLENYRVPGCAANMMSIIMVLLGRLCDAEGRDRQALLICSPILQEFRATAMAAARQDHTDTEYPQFHRNGQLRELFYEIDLFRPLNRMPPSAPKTGVRVRDEFLNCDFPTVGQMVDFAHHPFMARLSREILEPLYQFFLRIREDFTWSPETKTKGEKRVMCQRVRDYLEMAGRLSDYVIRHHDLAEAKHIPTPRVAWLQVVMRADSVYGFEGDDNQLLRVILRGKIASLLQYSERLRQHAVDHIVEKDDEGTRTQRTSTVKGENPFYGLPGVIEEGEVEAMETCLAISPKVGPSSFVHMWAHIWKKRAALEYAKSNIEAPFLDPSVIWSLTMARTFHYMIGQPAYELNDAWTCENALLQDEIEASQGVGRGLEKAVEQAEAGYGQSPSGRFFV
ncbi:hypothetical protein B0H13DRAFT_1916574 [Mycena leptocephala]|nr:hypothetical protein B0H13DRAFT_1916574 [Mycena leptocephala]